MTIPIGPQPQPRSSTLPSLGNRAVCERSTFVPGSSFVELNVPLAAAMSKLAPATLKEISVSIFLVVGSELK